MSASTNFALAVADWCRKAGRVHSRDLTRELLGTLLGQERRLRVARMIVSGVNVTLAVLVIAHLVVSARRTPPVRFQRAAATLGNTMIGGARSRHDLEDVAVEHLRRIRVQVRPAWAQTAARALEDHRSMEPAVRKRVLREFSEGLKDSGGKGQHWTIPAGIVMEHSALRAAPRVKLRALERAVERAAKSAVTDMVDARMERTRDALEYLGTTIPALGDAPQKGRWRRTVVDRLERVGETFIEANGGKSEAHDG